MQNESDSMTSNKLKKHLKQLFNTDGSWNWNSVRDMEPSVWATWMEYRLEGKDPFIRYGPDEYPDNAQIPFLELARMEFEEKVKGSGIDKNRMIVLDNFRLGAVQFLTTLDPIKEEAYVISNTIDVIGNLKARSDASLEMLRKWINRKVFLEGEKANPDLHNEVLLGLASLQIRGNYEDEEIWKNWIDPPEDAPDFYNTFVPAAFCGIIFSHEDIPKYAVEGLFKAIYQAESAGRELEISGAFLSFFVNDDKNEPRCNRQIMNCLFGIVNGMSESKSKWNVFQKLGDMWGYYFPEYDIMRPAMLSSRPQPHSPSTLLPPCQPMGSPSISSTTFGKHIPKTETWR